MKAVYYRCLSCGFRALYFLTDEFRPLATKFECFECYLVRTRKIDNITPDHSNMNDIEIVIKEQKHEEEHKDRFELIEME